LLRNWVPFSETSAHQSKLELWPVFLLDEAYWVARPLATLVACSVIKEKLPIEKYQEAEKKLGYHSLYVESCQLKKLLSLLNNKD
jgi:hypothetical protein